MGWQLTMYRCNNCGNDESFIAGANAKFLWEFESGTDNQVTERLEEYHTVHTIRCAVCDSLDVETYL